MLVALTTSPLRTVMSTTKMTVSPSTPVPVSTSRTTTVLVVMVLPLVQSVFAQTMWLTPFTSRTTKLSTLTTVWELRPFKRPLVPSTTCTSCPTLSPASESSVLLLKLITAVDPPPVPQVARSQSPTSKSMVWLVQLTLPLTESRSWLLVLLSGLGRMLISLVVLLSVHVLVFHLVAEPPVKRLFLFFFFLLTWRR